MLRKNIGFGPACLASFFATALVLPVASLVRLRQSHHLKGSLVCRTEPCRSGAETMIRGSTSTPWGTRFSFSGVHQFLDVSDERLSSFEIHGGVLAFKFQKREARGCKSDLSAPWHRNRNRSATLEGIAVLSWPFLSHNVSQPHPTVDAVVRKHSPPEIRPEGPFGQFRKFQRKSGRF